MTAESGRALATLGVVLHDHVIVGNGRCVSFRAEGLLWQAGRLTLARFLRPLPRERAF